MIGIVQLAQQIVGAVIDKIGAIGASVLDVAKTIVS